jgi:signal peptidase I
MIIIFLFINLIFIPISSAETIVVESGSMMHSRESSSETLDPGDIIEVIEIDSRNDIITYVEGKSKGYKKFGDYGDVIVCDENALGDIPIIHRAVCWIEFNDTTLDYDTTTGHWTGGAYDIPELHVYGLTGAYSILDYGYEETLLMIDFQVIIDNFANITNRNTGLRIGLRSYPHSGFLTKGDSNMMCDQNSLRWSNSVVFVKPIKIEWIKGKAKFFEETWLELYLIYIVIGVIIALIMIVIIIIFFKKKKTEDLKYSEPYKGRPSKRCYHTQHKIDPPDRGTQQAPVRRIEPYRFGELPEREGPGSAGKRPRR